MLRNSSRLFDSPPVQLDLVKTAVGLVVISSWLNHCWMQGSNETAGTVQHLAVVCPNEKYRSEALANVITTYGDGRALIFTDTKVDAGVVMVGVGAGVRLQLSDNIGRRLSKDFAQAVLHGDVPQSSRERALNAFRKAQPLACLAS